MRELLGDLGFRHTKEERLEPAARVPGTPKSAARATLGGGGSCRRWWRQARVWGREFVYL